MSTRWTAVARGALLGGTIAFGSSVAAQDASSGSGSDGSSDDRLADDASGPRSGNERLRLTLSGQVSRGVLLYDDGDDSGVIHVDNDNSSTRLRFVAESPVDDGLLLGALIEVEFQSNPSNLVSQVDERDVGSNTFDERKFELYARSDRYGELLVGQGETASDGSAEVDLSGTGIAGYSDVDDTGGGLRFRADGVLGGIDVASVYANLDGLGRDDRLRYDTPSFGDVNVSVSFASDRSRDLALRWNRDREGERWQAAGALAWADLGDGNADADGDRGAEDTTERVSGSLSFRHVSGWNVTLAGGRADAPERTPHFGYAKLGYRLTPFALGETRVSVDYHVSSDVARDDETAASVGLQLVQQVDRFDATLFAVLRSYDYTAARGAFATEDGGFADGLDTDSQADAIAVSMIGLRVPF